MKHNRENSEEEIIDDEEGDETEVLPPDEELDGGKPTDQPLATRERSYALRELPSKPSNWPWVNRFRRKGIETFTEVIKAENQLMGALVDHTKSKARLGDIDTEIEADHIERRLRLKGLQREEKGVGQDDEIAELDRKITIADKKKKLAELEGAPQPKTNKTPEELHEERMENLKKGMTFKAREQAAKLFGQFETRKEIEREAERRKGDILKGRKPGELSQNEKDALEDLEDMKNYALGQM